MKTYICIFIGLISFHCNKNDFNRINELITQKQYAAATEELINLQEAKERKEIDNYYSTLDLLLKRELKEEVKSNPRKKINHGLWVISITNNIDFSVNPSKNRMLLCKLWEDYLKKYPAGSLKQFFKREMLAFGEVRYRSLQDEIAKEFVTSKDSSLEENGYKFLAENAFMNKDYLTAIKCLTALIESGNYKPSYMLIIAECNYLSGDLKQATNNLKIACASSTGEEKEKICELVSHWLKDYKEAFKNKHANNKRHVFIEYF
jgi:hypothetical protein